MLVLGEAAAPRVVANLAKHGDIAVLLLLADDAAGLRQVKFGWPEENK